MTLSQLTRQAAASLTAARLIQKEIENLMCSPIGTPQQEAAKTPVFQHSSTPAAANPPRRPPQRSLTY